MHLKDSAVESELRKLRYRQRRIEAGLADAEQRWRIEDDAAVHWLAELRALAFDIDDLLEDYGTRTKILPFSSWKSDALQGYYRSVLERIKEILVRFDAINGDRAAQRMSLADGARLPAVPLLEANPFETTSLQGTFHIHGRCKQRDDVIELLKRPYGGTNDIPIISIVGQCGIGKTMLAQAIFNDEAVIECFSLRIWVCVNQGFDAIRTTRKIIKAITNQDCTLSTLDMLQHQLQQLVGGEKFLVVLDGICIEEPRYWETMRTPLLSGRPGSKVLITARSEVVPRNMGQPNSLLQLLERLDDHSCWLVFRDHAFSQPTGTEAQNLAHVGKEIALKCSGSPLAAKLLGMTLHKVTDEKQWRNLLAEMPDPSDIVENILSVLRISYDQLPLYLKHCFAYCSIFPKDYEFDKDDLVKLWMAEGLIKEDKNTKMEDIGCKYFNNLLWRSFFQTCDKNQKDKQKYMIPSALHDLAQSLSRYECSRIDHLGVQHGRGDERARYALLCHYRLQHNAWPNIYEWVSLRTLIVHPGRYGVPMDYVPTGLFENLRCLRVLDLSYIQVKQLPDSLGELIHLRYLSLHGSLVEGLPELLCYLHNLQTLELGECYKLKSLPRGLSSLVNMRHIDLHVDWETWDRNDLVSMPPGIGGLKFLQTLSRFNVASGDGCGIEELKDLDLRGELCISKLENVVTVENAKKANLSGKEHLKFIILQWSDRSSFHSRKDEKVIKHLCPPKTIKHIWIERYGGAKFPDWLHCPSFATLETLRLSNCRNCMNLPQVGDLPQLRELYIEGLHKVKSLGNLVCNNHDTVGFPLLEVLSLSDMPDIETWFESTDDKLRHLSQLVISGCPKLSNLSHLPRSLQKVELRNCPGVKDCPDVPSLRYLIVERTNQETITWSQQIASLFSLSISNIKGLEYLQMACSERLNGLRRLKIDGCNELVSVAGEGLRNLSLSYLEISSCVRLEHFADKGLPLTLKELRLRHLDSLATLPEGMHLLDSLHTMEIESTPNLASLPLLPSKLQYLFVKGCQTHTQSWCKIDGADQPNIQHVPHIYWR